jgi:hypothetical protein
MLCILADQLAGTQVVETQSTSPWLAAGVGLAVGALLLLLGLIVFVISRRSRISPEERQLKATIAELRTRLRITAADGFLLTSERNSGVTAVCQHWHRRSPVVIQRSFVESAARLSLFQDFDVYQFDAFCICLRCSKSNNDSAENSSLPPEYYALCDWLLDICRALIRPDIGGAGSGSSFNDIECSLPNEERFPYFQKRVCRARVWSDMGGSLFQRLRQVAQARAYPKELKMKIKTALQDQCRLKYRTDCTASYGKIQVHKKAWRFNYDRLAEGRV